MVVKTSIKDRLLYNEPEKCEKYFLLKISVLITTVIKFWWNRPIQWDLKVLLWKTYSQYYLQEYL